jgi:hypothetical protein
MEYDGAFKNMKARIVVSSLLCGPAKRKLLFVVEVVFGTSPYCALLYEKRFTTRFLSIVGREVQFLLNTVK